MQRASKIQRRSGPIVGLFVVVATVLLVGFAIALWTTQSDARSGINDRFKSSAARSAVIVQSMFSTSFGSSGTGIAEQFSAETITQAQIDAVQRGGQAPYAAVIGPDGEVLAASTGTPAEALQRLRGQRPTPAADGKPTFTVSDVHPGPSGGSVEVATSFVTPSGTRSYVTAVSGQAIAPFLASLLAQGPNPSGVVMYLVDSGGRTIASSSKTVFGATIPDQRLATAIRAGTSGSVSSSDGERRFATAPIGGTPWRIVASAPQDRLYASVSGGRVLIPWLLVIVLAVAAAGTLWLLTRLLGAEREIGRAYAALSSSHEDLERSAAEVSKHAQELARSNAELAQFASIASHDLQEPLRKVQSYGEELQSSFGDVLGEEGTVYVARMRRAAARMQSLIDDLLRLARIATRGEPLQALPLDAVLTDVVDDLAVTFSDAGADVQVSALPVVLGDRAQLEQLFRNLLTNAVKFARADVTPQVQVTARRLGDGMTEVRVTDNGIGFEQAYAERIFETFQRLHRREEYPGTGIGLALCRKIVERHGGTIRAESTPGVGTVMRFTLQLVADAVPVSAPPVAQPVGGTR